MTAYWQPTATGYFGRVSKERIVEAVRDGVSEQAAQNIVRLKKPAMAEAAEAVLRAIDALGNPLWAMSRSNARDCLSKVRQRSWAR
jgi:hypothetical protein